MVSIPSAVVEEVLAKLYDIAPDKRVALRGRIKHFQRMGFPARTNTGKGVPAKFSFDRLLQLVFAFELVQSGLDPSAARSVMSEHWHVMSPACARSMIQDAEVIADPLKFKTGSLVFSFYIDALYELQSGPFSEYFGELLIAPKNDMADFLFKPEHASKYGVQSPWRVLVIDVENIVLRATEITLSMQPAIDRLALFEDVRIGEPEWGQPYLLEVSPEAF